MLYTLERSLCASIGMDLVHVEKEATLIVVRVLVAIAPQMYREVLAFHFRQQRPRSEVVLSSPQTLEDEAKRMRPHLIIANEVPPMLKEMGLWVEVHTGGERLDADVSADGISTTIHDVSLQDLVAAVDKAEEELAHGS